MSTLQSLVRCPTRDLRSPPTRTFVWFRLPRLRAWGSIGGGGILLGPHMPYLLSAARRTTRNEANAHDLVQDTCVHALEFLARGGALPDNPRGWLLVVMRNQWISVMRHHRVRSNARAELAGRAAVDSGLHESRVTSEQFERAWSALSSQAQEVARQCLIEGDSYEDVSRRFGITTGGIACSIHRTREQLRLTMFGAGSP